MSSTPSSSSPPTTTGPTTTTTPSHPPPQDASLTADLYSTLGSSYSDIYSHDPGLINFLQLLLTKYLPTASQILDVGSGTGTPVALTLSEAGHRVTGLDMSSEMVRLSRLTVPTATFHLADMQTYTPPSDQNFDAILLILSLFEFGREEIEAVVARYAGFLEVGRLLCVGTMAAEDVHLDGVGDGDGDGDGGGNVLRRSEEQEEEDGKGKRGYDPDGCCARDVDNVFMGYRVKITLFTLEGWRWLCAKVGLEIVDEVRMLFVPPVEARTDNEMHYFFVARKL